MFVPFFEKIGKLIETFKRSYTQALLHGDDHKIQLTYISIFVLLLLL